MNEHSISVIIPVYNVGGGTASLPQQCYQSNMEKP